MSETLLELASRCEQATHSDRRLNSDIGAALGEQFQQAFTTSIDAACTLVPDGFLWCVGTSSDEDRGLISWANVRLPDNPHQRLDISIEAATPALALCGAALKARAQATPQGETV